MHHAALDSVGVAEQILCGYNVARQQCLPYARRADGFSVDEIGFSAMECETQLAGQLGQVVEVVVVL